MEASSPAAPAQAGPGQGAFHRGGTGEPMLCVHGITDTWRTWEVILPLLEPHHDVLAITLLGHSGGRAPDPDAQVTLKALVDEAERDMDAAGFETAHLVGNSLGGWVVLELAARGRARSVTALSPAGGWEVGNRRAMRSYWELVSTQWSLRHFEGLALKLVARPRSRWLALGNLVSHPPSVSASLAAALVRGAADCPAALPLLEESRRDGYPDLNRIDCPVRIAWGTQDRLLPVEKLSARLRQLLPDAEWIELEGAGHLPQIDHPRETADVILEATRAASGASAA
jgi:pimeloyl-ACP methyl ester carboxylesterase